MSLKRKFQIVYASIVVAAIVSLLVIVANILYFQKSTRDDLQNVNGAETEFRNILLCLVQLQNEANSYAMKADESKAMLLENKSKECLLKMHSLRAFGVSDSFLEKSTTLLKDYTRGTLQVGARKASAILNLKKANDKIRNFTLDRSLSRVVGLREYLNETSSNISAHLLDNKQFDLTYHERTHEELKQRLSQSHIPVELRERLLDLFYDIEGTLSIWNKMSDQEQFIQENEQQKVFNIPAEVSIIVNRMLEQVINKARHQLVVLIIVGALLALGFLVGAAFLFQWVFDLWTRTMDGLKDYSMAVLQGVSIPLEWYHRQDVVSDESDEIALAQKAIVNTITQLNDFKLNLEKKVEEKTRSLLEVEKTLQQSQKLASLGQLSAGVAHELNNPLQVILFAAESMERLNIQDQASAGAWRSKLDKIRQQVDRMNKIISQLKGLSRKDDPSKYETVPMIQIIEGIKTLVSTKLKEQNVELIVGSVPDLSLICHPVKIESVLSNIVSNAVDAYSLKPGSNSVPKIEIRFSISSEQWLCIELEDFAGGIPLEVQEKIFEPFFTTKDIGHGTGLGLSLSHAIMQEMGGALEFSSEVGKGTVFKVKIPKSRVVKIMNQGRGVA